MSSSASPSESKISLLSHDSTSSSYDENEKASGTGLRKSFSPFVALRSKYSTDSSSSVTSSSSAPPLLHAQTQSQPPPPLTSASALSSHPTKDYEASFGALASSFGYGGGAPIIVKSKKTQTKSATQTGAAAPSTSNNTPLK
ncbi:hypothetical protein HETIRDRAFT_168830 [Heterobasidion irregulare TC 32-1]|uniref:Uncharacterized protein n=1 Tax=Heterobasidion irregulare (strain TC 32-1) TaxID=747525 RepID=W4K8Q7_HETIT|nr:uncharacterized protein HETIRDRAFT_168830 [Heterobasidion irregulare TC 32-1]ETW82217.1 hypothetical protein HETIRDRAFT_168830 [Heterobasidion irregulare TC 32-1]